MRPSRRTMTRSLKPDDLRQFRGDQEDGFSRRCERGQHAVDFDLRRDVDAPCRLIEDEDAQVFNQHPFRQHDLLLVAAAQPPHRPAGAARAHVELVEHPRHRFPLAPAIEDAGLREPAHGRKAGVVDDRALQRQPVAHPVLRDERNAVRDGIGRRGDRHLAPVDEDPPAVGRLRAEHRPCHVASSAAHEPEHSDDLARPHGEGDSFVGRPPAKVAHLERGAARLRRPLRIDGVERPPHHGADEFVPGHRPGRCERHAAAVLQDEDVVRDVEDLIQAMRDVEHRGAGGGELADLLEQEIGLVRRQDRRRLVENEDAWPRDECLRDLDDLQDRDRQVADARLHVDVREAEIPDGGFGRVRWSPPSRRSSAPGGAAIVRAGCFPRRSDAAAGSAPGGRCGCRARWPGADRRSRRFRRQGGFRRGPASRRRRGSS